MFDHVKHIKRYTIFACHVYDSRYCKVIIIAICDMMSETHDAWAYLWHGLNGVMAKHGVHNVNFEKFIADSCEQESSTTFNCVLVQVGDSSSHDKIHHTQMQLHFTQRGRSGVYNTFLLHQTIIHKCLSTLHCQLPMSPLNSSTF